MRPAHPRRAGAKDGLDRDPARTPMRWEAGAKAGFTIGEPWLPLGGGIAGRNAAARRDDRYPMLSPYRRLLALRRSERVLLAGHFVPRRNHSPRS